MKLSIAAAAMLAFSMSLSLSTVSAQSGNQRPEGRRPPPHHDLEALGLTQTQQQEVKLILQSHHEEMRALRSEGASCADHQELRGQIDAALSEVLTAEQLTAFQSQKPSGQGGGPRQGSCETAVSK